MKLWEIVTYRIRLWKLKNFILRGINIDRNSWCCLCIQKCILRNSLFMADWCILFSLTACSCNRDIRKTCKSENVTIPTTQFEINFLWLPKQWDPVKPSWKSFNCVWSWFGIRSSQKSRLGIESIDLLHQEPTEDRLTP